MSAARSLVAARIRQYPACKVIDLTEAEKDLYHGAARYLAVFSRGALKALHDPAGDTLWSPSASDMADAATKKAGEILRALESAAEDTEVWLVDGSCYQLCDPVRITSDHHDLMMIRDQFLQDFEQGVD